MSLTPEEKAAKEAEKAAAEEAKKAAKEAEKAAKEAEKAARAAGTKELKVLDKSGSYVRTYSAAEHGPDFIDLAEGFAAKIKGSVSK